MNVFGILLYFLKNYSKILPEFINRRFDVYE